MANTALILRFVEPVVDRLSPIRYVVELRRWNCLKYILFHIEPACIHRSSSLIVIYNLFLSREQSIYIYIYYSWINQCYSNIMNEQSHLYIYIFLNTFSIVKDSYLKFLTLFKFSYEKYHFRNIYFL